MLDRISVGLIHCLKSIFVVLFTSKYAASVGCTDLHDFEILGGDRVILSMYAHVEYFFLRGAFYFYFFLSRKEGRLDERGRVGEI